MSKRKTVEISKTLVTNNLDMIFALINNYLQSSTDHRLITVGSILDKLPFKIPQSIKKRDYYENGRYRIIDQGKVSNGGYTNDESFVIKNSLPLIVFGDHTTAIKYIDHPFAIGADGVKLLKPKSVLLPKYFYYALHGANFVNKGYGRHYKRLRESKIIIPYADDAEKSQIFQSKVINFLDDLVNNNYVQTKLYFHNQTENEVLRFLRSVINIQTLQKRKENQLELIGLLRQQILQDAITGKLSEKWRKENPDIESAEVLLEKVKAEKEKLVKVGRIRKQKPLPPIKENEMPFVLPPKWIWCRLQDLLETIQYGSSVKCTTEKEEGMTAVLRIPNVSSGEVNLDDLKYANLSIKEKNALNLKKGDLLIIRSNGSKDIVGQATLVRQDMDSFSYAGYLIRLRTLVESEYLLGCFRSDLIRSQIETPLRTTVGINNINSTEISNLLIPLPPEDEQHQIIGQLEVVLHKIENLKVKNNYAIETIAKMRKTILKDMFSE